VTTETFFASDKGEQENVMRLSNQMMIDTINNLIVKLL
jgi:hypothetical protein